MGLFESDYQRNVLTAVEKEMRKMEANKTPVSLQRAETIVDFMSEANLLKATELANFRRRMENAKREYDYKRIRREHTADIVDGFTNSLEMAKKFETLDDMQAEVNRQKAFEASQQDTREVNTNMAVKGNEARQNVQTNNTRQAVSSSEERIR